MVRLQIVILPNVVSSLLGRVWWL